MAKGGVTKKAKVGEKSEKPVKIGIKKTKVILEFSKDGNRTIFILTNLALFRIRMLRSAL
jgi:hypothetical protein